MKVFIFCVFFINTMLLCNTLDEARFYSYEGSVEYINRNFEKSSVLFKDSLEIRRKLKKIDSAYITILKLLILSNFKGGNFCDLKLEIEDKTLLYNEGDLDFLHEFETIKNSCVLF